MPAISLQLGARHLINVHHKLHAKCVSIPVSKQPYASTIMSRNHISRIHIATYASSNGASSNADSPPPAAESDEPKSDLDLLLDLMSADDESDEALQKVVETYKELLQNQFFQSCADALPALEEKFGKAAGDKIRSVLTKVMECQMALSPPEYQLLNRLSLLETEEQRVELLDSLPEETLIAVLKAENYRFFKLVDDMIIDLDKRRYDTGTAEMFVQRAKNSRELAFSRLPKEQQEEVDNKAWMAQKEDIDLLFKLLGADEVEQFDQMYEAVLEEFGEARFSDKFFTNCMQMVQVIPENDAIVRDKMKKLVEKIFNLQFSKMPLDYQLINVLTMAENLSERKKILDDMEDNVLQMTLSMAEYRFWALLDETEKDLEENGSGVLNEDETKLKLERLRNSRRDAYERLNEEGKKQVAKPV